MKPINNVYEKLKDIKRPVMLYVTHENNKIWTRDRIRILYPNGKCEWLGMSYWYDLKEKFGRSCFVNKYNLYTTLKEMERYDWGNFQVIVKIEEL